MMPKINLYFAKSGTRRPIIAYVGGIFVMSGVATAISLLLWPVDYYACDARNDDKKYRVYLLCRAEERKGED